MKKILIILLSIVMAFSLLVFGFGCKDTEAPEEETVEEEAVEEVEEEVEEEAVEEVEEVTEEEKPYAGSEIVVVAASGTNRDVMYKDWASEFEELTGIKINVLDFPWEQLHDKYANDFISQTGAYDVVEEDVGWDGEFIKFFEILDPYIDRDNFDMSDYFDAFQDPVGRNVLTDYQRYGMPLLAYTFIMYYRTDLFEEAGLDADEVFKYGSWDNFIEAEKKLDEMYADQGISAFVTQGVNVQLVKMFFATFVILEDAAWFDEDYNCILDTSQKENGIKAIETLKEIYKYTPEGTMTLDMVDSGNVFVAGEAAMHANWPFAATPFLEEEGSNVKGNWEIVAPPGPGNVGPWLLCIPSSSTKKDQAWEFIKFVSSPEKQKQALAEYGIEVARKSAWEDPEVLNQGLGAEGFKEAMSNTFWPMFFFHPKGIEFFVYVGGVLSDAITGNISPEEAVIDMADKWNNELNVGVELPEKLKSTTGF
jgi:ABC-type glycerol-3-phosphate transport system substrate-binding protein